MAPFFWPEDSSAKGLRPGKTAPGGCLPGLFSLTPFIRFEFLL